MLARIFSFGCAALLLMGVLHAQPPASQPAQQPADPRVQIASKIPGTRAEDLRPTPVPGLYEMTRGTDIAYVTADGKYALSGDLIELASNDNLTETRRRDLRAKLIGTIPESEMVVFCKFPLMDTATVSPANG